MFEHCYTIWNVHHLWIQESHSPPVKVTLQVLLHPWHLPPEVMCKSSTEPQKWALHQLFAVSKLHGSVPRGGIRAGVKNQAIKLERLQGLQWWDTSCVQHCTAEVAILQRMSRASLSPYQCSVLCNLSALLVGGNWWCIVLHGQRYSSDLALLSGYRSLWRAIGAWTSTWTLVQCPVASGSQKHDFRSF